MFDFIEKLMQPQVESFERNKEYYIIFGIIMTLVWFFGKNSRRQEMKKLAKDISLPFRSYAIKWDLLPILTPLYKGYNIGFPINFIEGEISGRYFLIFDFYYRKWSYFQTDTAEKLITYINGKYYKNCSAEELRHAINANNFSSLILGDEINEYVRFREVAVLNTYGNIRLRGKAVILENVLKVTNAFRTINYGSFLGKMEDGMLMNKLNVNIAKSVDEVENKLKSWNVNISNENIKFILDEYFSILHLHDINDMLKEVNLNKLK